MKQSRNCNICKRILPLTDEFFARSGMLGYDRKCKDCKKKWNDEYYATHPRPQALQHHIGKFLVRYSKRLDHWKVYIKSPWTYCETFKTEEEAYEWIGSR